MVDRITRPLPVHKNVKNGDNRPGGRPLRNLRRERFAQLTLTAKSISDAYSQAGYKPNGQAAFALYNLPEVAARISVLQERAADKAGVDKARVLQELERIGTSDLRKAVTWGEGLRKTRTKLKVPVKVGDKVLLEEKLVERTVVGNFVRLKDSDQLDDATAAAISEVSLSAEGELRVKLHPKLPALQTLAEHFGLIKNPDPRGGVTVQILITGNEQRY